MPDGSRLTYTISVLPPPPPSCMYFFPWQLLLQPVLASLRKTRVALSKKKYFFLFSICCCCSIDLRVSPEPESPIVGRGELNICQSSPQDALVRRPSWELRLGSHGRPGCRERRTLLQRQTTQHCREVHIADTPHALAPQQAPSKATTTPGLMIEARSDRLPLSTLV